MKRDPLEQRLLILAPIGRDAALIERMLKDLDRPCSICPTLEMLIAESRRGAAVLVIAEEALGDPSIGLAQLLSQQPPWSDMPVLVLTRTGASSAIAEHAAGSFGNVTLLERPVRVAALTSAVRSAARARERQYQIRAYIAERDRADQRKDEFLATLAHELRNPLAPIRSSLDILAIQPSQDTLDGLLDTMDRQVNHMMRLVDDLMDVSRVTRGKIRLQSEPLRLASILKAAVEISRPQMEAAGHQLVFTPPPADARVLGDQVRLTQVFSNLLNNAAKYTNAGGRIALSTKAGTQWLQVDVSDNGIGIAPEALSHVFDMFYQASADQRSLTGLGIGLTLVRTLVDMHGGSVSVHSRGSGHGSTFTVRLPLHVAEDLPAAKPEKPAASQGNVPQVMVVDDNRDAADMLALLLQTLGAEVRVAHDGPAALAALETWHPAAIFLDIGMPGMDGYEVAGRVRAQRHPRDPLLVALTGWGQERDRARTEAAGFAHHLVKPADAGKLRAVLASLPH